MLSLKLYFCFYFWNLKNYLLLLRERQNFSLLISHFYYISKFSHLFVIYIFLHINVYILKHFNILLLFYFNYYMLFYYFRLLLYYCIIIFIIYLNSFYYLKIILKCIHLNVMFKMSFILCVLIWKLWIVTLSSVSICFFYLFIVLMDGI